MSQELPHKEFANESLFDRFCRAKGLDESQANEFARFAAQYGPRLAPYMLNLDEIERAWKRWEAKHARD